MPLRYFIYDMDGTLVDTSEAIVASVQRMEEVMGLPRLPMEDLRKMLGPPFKDSLMRFYGATLEETEEMTKVYRKCYMEVGIDKTVVFEDVKDFLHYVRSHGGKNALATLKQHQLATEIIARSGLAPLFDHVALNLQNGVGSKPALIRECLAAIGCRKTDEAVMFGDSPFDGKAAAEAGIHFVPLSCSDGFAPAGSLDGIPHIYNAKTVKAMHDFICSSI